MYLQLFELYKIDYLIQYVIKWVNFIITTNVLNWINSRAYMYLSVFYNFIILEFRLNFYFANLKFDFLLYCIFILILKIV